MSFKKMLCVSACAALSSLVTPKAGADTVSFGGSVPSAPTDFNTTVAVQQFNPLLGVLNSIQFTVNGHVVGDIKLESKDSQPSNVTGSLKANISISDPSSLFSVAVAPSHDEMVSFTAYDGLLDFGGTSGASFLGVTGNASNSGTLTNALLFTPFIGTGNVSLPVSAAGASSGSGSGNLVTMFATSASADVTVVYDYTPSVPGSGVPLPSTALGGLSLLIVGSLKTARRRRRSA